MDFPFCSSEKAVKIPLGCIQLSTKLNVSSVQGFTIVQQNILPIFSPCALSKYVPGFPPTL